MGGLSHCKRRDWAREGTRGAALTLLSLPSSDRGRHRGRPLCRAAGPAAHVPHEEERRGQLRPGQEAHLQKGPRQRVLRLRLPHRTADRLGLGTLEGGL